MIQIQARLTRYDVGITYIHTFRLRQYLQIATKIKRRVSIALNAQNLIGVLLRLEQGAGAHRVAELLH